MNHIITQGSVSVSLNDNILQSSTLIFIYLTFVLLVPGPMEDDEGYVLYEIRSMIHPMCCSYTHIKITAVCSSAAFITIAIAFKLCL